MTTLCTAEQLAEAVTIWSIQYFGQPVLCAEREDADDLKSLDLFLSTMEVFSEAFGGKYEIAHDKQKHQFLLSKNNFIDYLKPRCLLLAHNNGCFDLMLICSFVYYTIQSICFDKCFHFARVAYKLLATVLEETFSDLFNTDLGWEKLMSYCRNIHSVVFPSKENRPPCNDKYCKCKDDDSSNKDKMVDGKEPGFNEEFIENKLIQQESLQSNAEYNVIFNEQILENCIDISDSSDTESLDDNSAYWDFETMSNWTICKTITENQKHLQDVLNLLDLFVQQTDPENASSNKYDIPISDDEDIEKIERRFPKRDKSRWKIKLSDGNLVDFATYDLCKKKNKELSDSSENLISFEDITADQRLQHLAEINKTVYGEPQCKLCHGRIREFYTNWVESYRKKFSNNELCSDFL